ncbi:hypothetical protein H9633_10960 [Microbacterium sp. Re1]|uniref:Uncharacterized protein n=1 Tax=Microbacterium commune TaxID=2762219 RepID=A0ABR8W7W8_9MICO|nr:hypothetical protein [Microbacterium commune]MBD8012816.1 hypothetical protein [Microbacterium commune]
MSTIHHPRHLRRFLPGKPDAETAFWLTVCGAACLSGPILEAVLIQVVIR